MFTVTPRCALKRKSKISKKWYYVQHGPEYFTTLRDNCKVNSIKTKSDLILPIQSSWKYGLDDFRSQVYLPKEYKSNLARRLRKNLQPLIDIRVLFSWYKQPIIVNYNTGGQQYWPKIILKNFYNYSRLPDASKLERSIFKGLASQLLIHVLARLLVVFPGTTEMGLEASGDNMVWLVKYYTSIGFIEIFPKCSAFLIKEQHVPMKGSIQEIYKLLQ
jgi:hypothetical protein